MSNSHEPGLGAGETDSDAAEGLARAHLLGAPTDRDGLRSLLERVESHRQDLTDAPDTDRSNAVMTDLVALISLAIERFDELDDDSIALIKGAAEYYILDDDFEEDAAPGGMADDHAVLGAVRRHLGL